MVYNEQEQFAMRAVALIGVDWIVGFRSVLQQMGEPPCLTTYSLHSWDTLSLYSKLPSCTTLGLRFLTPWHSAFVTPFAHFITRKHQTNPTMDVKFWTSACFVLFSRIFLRRGHLRREKYPCQVTQATVRNFWEAISLRTRHKWIRTITALTRMLTFCTEV